MLSFEDVSGGRIDGFLFVGKGEQHNDIVLHGAYRLLELQDLGAVYLDPVVHVSLDALIIPLKNLDHPMPPLAGHDAANTHASTSSVFNGDFVHRTCYVLTCKTQDKFR